ncbi:MAG: tetratricopeptide repeat protein [Bacteroidetes bacterium]|nr:tetratricopeptide repeat protein [Bacteroidota bacterium]
MGESFSEDKDNLQELLLLYEQLKKGQGRGYLEEDSFERIIVYYQDQEQFKKALEAARFALERFPYSSPLKIKLADVLIALRRFRDAKAVLEEAALLDNRDINLYILQVEVFLALELPIHAHTIHQEALGLFEGEERIELLFELADVYDDYEEYERVFECIRDVLESDPTNEEALYKICFWTDFTGQNEESIRLHQSILEDFPYSELAWFNLGAAYQGLKLYEKAIDAYQYAIAIEEKFDYAYRNMGDALIRLRRYKEALEALQRVTELTKPEDVIFEAMGFCYERLKQPAQARSQYRKAVYLRPDDSLLHYKIAVTYHTERQWERAIRQIETALKRFPRQPDYNKLAGECYARLGQWQQAVDHLALVVRSRPKTAASWEALITCLFQAGDHAEACKQSANAFTATGNKPLFLYYRAAAFFGLSQPAQGLEWLEKALNQAPKLLKKFMEVFPSALQHRALVDLLAKHKRRRSF